MFEIHRTIQSLAWMSTGAFLMIQRFVRRDPFGGEPLLCFPKDPREIRAGAYVAGS